MSLAHRMESVASRHVAATYPVERSNIMVELATPWRLSIERGPEWLFVRLSPPANALETPDGLAAHLWQTLEQHFCNRIVLEMDEVRLMSSTLLGQLVLLHKRVVTHGGLLRLSGLSEENAAVLKFSRLDGRFPRYADRTSAVLGHRPAQPR